METIGRGGIICLAGVEQIEKVWVIMQQLLPTNDSIGTGSRL